MWKRSSGEKRCNSSGRGSSDRRLRFEQLEDRQLLATLTVGTTSENLSSIPVDNGVLTLREAIDYVNGTFVAQTADSQRINTFGGTQPLGVNDTIVFDPAFFNIPRTITLTQGVLLITESVTIDATVDGAGNSQELLDITIDAGGGTNGVVGNGDGSTIFSIVSGDVEFNGSKLTGGDYGGFRGGAIYSSSNLTVRNSTITGGERYAEFALAA